jgi:hypothetical protein
MNWYGGGFLNVLCYSIFAIAIAENNTLLTENNFDILTEDGQDILVES